jgi:sporulation protein YlmC with PRC-barrel domain
MLQKAMTELRGEEILARDGRLGAVDDIYFDGDSWRVRYLVVATGAGLRGPYVLVSAACVTDSTAAGDRLLVELSRSQMELGAGAWPMESASGWLQDARVCGGRLVVGWRILAEDGVAGRLADLLVDNEEWSINYIVIDGEEPADGSILLPIDWVVAIDFERRAVRVRCTREELRNSPRV